jgi:hypothetical protein
MRGLGFETATVIGHDRGARVGHRWGLDHPEEVERLVVMDIIPTREMWRRMDMQLASRYWHWLFHLQPDLPELLAGANPAAYLGYFLERWTHNRAGMDEAAIAEYVRAFSAPGALRAGFDDYRASFPLDAEHDDADAAAGRKLTMPVLVLWGANGLFGQLPALEIWQAYASAATGAASPSAATSSPRSSPTWSSASWPGSCRDSRRARLPDPGRQTTSTRAANANGASRRRPTGSGSRSCDPGRRSTPRGGGGDDGEARRWPLEEGRPCRPPTPSGVASPSGSSPPSCCCWPSRAWRWWWAPTTAPGGPSARSSSSSAR